MSDRLTRYQAMVIGAYTGIACGPFEDIHVYAEKLLGRPVWTHEFADRQVWKALREAARPDFLDISFDEHVEAP